MPRNFDPASLAAGLAISALGVLLLLDQTDTIDLRFGYLWPALLGTIGLILSRSASPANAAEPECQHGGHERAGAAGRNPAAAAPGPTAPSSVASARVSGGGSGSTRSSYGSSSSRRPRRRPRRFAYLLAWALLPAVGDARDAAARAGSRDSWSVAIGIGLLMLALLLLFRGGGCGSATGSCGRSCSPPPAAR